MPVVETKLSRKLTTQLLHLAQISPTKEVCGLIGSQEGKATSCYPIDNVAPQPERRFMLDAQQQIQAMAKMRNLNEQLFALYHSHPCSPAIPSQTDLELSAYPEALYLIISLNTKGILELRGFNLNQQTVTEVALSLEE
jgi:proteasome lid subunit RPN8/RPN11